jgi:hypothetical protein
VRVVVLFSPEEAEQLDVYAGEKGQSRSKAVRELVARVLRRRK